MSQQSSKLLAQLLLNGGLPSRMLVGAGGALASRAGASLLSSIEVLACGSSRKLWTSGPTAQAAESELPSAEKANAGDAIEDPDAEPSVAQQRRPQARTSKEVLGLQNQMHELSLARDNPGIVELFEKFVADKKALVDAAAEQGSEVGEDGVPAMDGVPVINEFTYRMYLRAVRWSTTRGKRRVSLAEKKAEANAAVEKLEATLQDMQARGIGLGFRHHVNELLGAAATAGRADMLELLGKWTEVVGGGRSGPNGVTHRFVIEGLVKAGAQDEAVEHLRGVIEAAMAAKEATEQVPEASSSDAGASAGEEEASAGEEEASKPRGTPQRAMTSIDAGLLASQTLQTMLFLGAEAKAGEVLALMETHGLAQESDTLAQAIPSVANALKRSNENRRRSATAASAAVLSRLFELRAKLDDPPPIPSDILKNTLNICAYIGDGASAAKAAWAALPPDDVDDTSRGAILRSSVYTRDWDLVWDHVAEREEAGLAADYLDPYESFGLNVATSLLTRGGHAARAAARGALEKRRDAGLAVTAPMLNVILAATASSYAPKGAAEAYDDPDHPLARTAALFDEYETHWGVSPDVGTYTALCDVYGRYRQLSEIQGVWQSLLDAGLPPSRMTFQKSLGAAMQAASSDIFVRTLAAMENRGHEPEVPFLAAALARFGYLSRSPDMAVKEPAAACIAALRETAERMGRDPDQLLERHREQMAAKRERSAPRRPGRFEAQ